MPAQATYRNPVPTTDIIIEYNDGKKNGVILIERKNPPYGRALPGGFAEVGLSLEENAAKEAREETGLEIKLLNPEQPFCVHSHPGRDNRWDQQIFSITYIAKGSGKLAAGDDAIGAKVYSLTEIADLVEQNGLAFDHGKTLTKYLATKGYTPFNQGFVRMD